MTAEVVVMNKSAVALASDSAVTASPTQKVFNSAEKLFMLIPGQPVGLLIYNYSEFMQLPWETIVKKYRIYSGNKSLGSLKEYAEDFIAYLSNPESELYSEEQYKMTFGKITHYYMRQIAHYIIDTVKKKIDDSGKKISGKEISEIISYWIDKYFQEWNNSENQYSEKDTATIKRGIRKFQSILDEVRDAVFGQVQLSEFEIEKLNNFCYSLFYKKKLSAFHTGLVIAGFGENELYPGCIEYVLENYFCGHLKYRMAQEAVVSPKNIGWIIPFAQKDIVYNFLNGIHPDFEEKLDEELNNVFSRDSVIGIINALKGLTQKRKKSILDSLEKVKKIKQDTVLEKVQADFKTNHTDSILSTVSILPKDELAKMAESLVNITSFMRRVSMDVESVGGPIDVAVISKKDGFIWIKRKHYFDPFFNPHYKKYSIGDMS
jgi:hypothetical protein